MRNMGDFCPQRATPRHLLRWQMGDSPRKRLPHRLDQMRETGDFLGQRETRRSPLISKTGDSLPKRLPHRLRRMPTTGDFCPQRETRTPLRLSLWETPAIRRFLTLTFL